MNEAQLLPEKKFKTGELYTRTILSWLVSFEFRRPTLEWKKKFSIKKMELSFIDNWQLMDFETIDREETKSRFTINRRSLGFVDSGLLVDFESINIEK